MPLTGPQQAFIERVLEKARQGRLKTPDISGRIVATMANPGVVRLEINGTTAHDTANTWVTACAAAAGKALRQASPGNSIVIHIPLGK